MVTEPARVLLGDVEVTRVPEYAGPSPGTSSSTLAVAALPRFCLW